MSRRIIIALSCGALALAGGVVGGCGSGSNDKNNSGAAATTDAAPSATPAPAEAGAVNVVMQNNKFAPETIKVKVGQKIHWANNDSYEHNVTATKGANFKSDNVRGGGTYDYTARKAGTIDYVCTIHSGQTGKIVVTQ
jgi:plastocyanin